MALAVVAVFAAISLRSPRTFPAGVTPQSILTADLNRDGTPDGLVFNPGTAVLLGNADGTLGTPNVLDPFGGQAAVGDFNADGLLDVAVTAGRLSVYLGHGDGTFASPLVTATVRPPFAMTVADFNGDGKANLAFVSVNTASVGILINHGDGTFDPAVYYDVDPGPSTIVSGDFNHDHHPDLAVLCATSSSTNGTIDLLLNTGDGTMQKSKAIASTATQIALGTADFDGSGVPDLVFGAPDKSSVTPMLARGDGTFDSRTLPLPGTYTEVTAVDVDGNGTPDLVVGVEMAGAFFHVIYANDGAASWQEIARYPDLGHPTAADLDGDGLPDLIYPKFVGGTVAVARGLGGGRFVGVPVIQGDFKPVAAGQPRGHFVATGDVTGDGKPDLVATNNNDTFSVFAGKGDGTFAAPISIAASGAASGGALTADVNGDGKRDIVTWSASASSSTISIFVNSGADFATPVTTSFSERIVSMTAADVNADRREDIIVTSFSHVRLFTLLANGTLQLLSNLNTNGALGTAAADFDRDGKIDLVVTDNFGNVAFDQLAHFYKGNGDGTFAELEPIAGPTTAQVVTSGDLNRDGILDLVSASPTRVSVWLGHGDGTFSLRDNVVTAGGAVAVADLDGDGAPDVIVASHGEITIYPGRGNGTLASPLSYAAVPNATTLAFADFDGDGRVDIAVGGGSGDNVIAVILNQSSPGRRSVVR